jgi:hypothetical protein
MYLVILNRVIFGDQIFYEGVSWSEYKKEGNDYKIVVDGVQYTISGKDAVETQYFTRSKNEDMLSYLAHKVSDKTTDYYKAVKEKMGIDMRINHAPQFRDGVNPLRDRKNEDDTED